MKIKRSTCYTAVGIILMVLGIMWNLAGMLYGTLSEASAVGWVVAFVGAFYLVRSRKAKLRENMARETATPQRPGTV